jgi:hypothetical protein
MIPIGSGKPTIIAQAQPNTTASDKAKIEKTTQMDKYLNNLQETFWYADSANGKSKNSVNVIDLKTLTTKIQNGKLNILRGLSQKQKYQYIDFLGTVIQQYSGADQELSTRELSEALNKPFLRSKLKLAIDAVEAK